VANEPGDLAGVDNPTAVTKVEVDAGIGQGSAGVCDQQPVENPEGCKSGVNQVKTLEQAAECVEDHLEHKLACLQTSSYSCMQQVWALPVLPDRRIMKGSMPMSASDVVFDKANFRVAHRTKPATRESAEFYSIKLYLGSVSQTSSPYFLVIAVIIAWLVRHDIIGTKDFILHVIGDVKAMLPELLQLQISNLAATPIPMLERVWVR